MSLLHDGLGFQKLKLVMIEEISKYLLFGILTLVDLIRVSSSTHGLGSGGLTAETLGMALLLSHFPWGALGTLVFSLRTDP